MNILGWLSNRFGDIFLKVTFHFSNTFSKKVNDGNVQDDQNVVRSEKVS